MSRMDETELAKLSDYVLLIFVTTHINLHRGSLWATKDSPWSFPLNANSLCTHVLWYSAAWVSQDLRLKIKLLGTLKIHAPSTWSSYSQISKLAFGSSQKSRSDRSSNCSKYALRLCSWIVWWSWTMFFGYAGDALQDLINNWSSSCDATGNVIMSTAAVLWATKDNKALIELSYFQVADVRLYEKILLHTATSVWGSVGIVAMVTRHTHPAS